MHVCCIRLTRLWTCLDKLIFISFWKKILDETFLYISKRASSTSLTNDGPGYVVQALIGPNQHALVKIVLNKSDPGCKKSV